MQRDAISNMARWALIVVVLAVAAARVYFAFVPWGASFYPWMMARVNGPILQSPDEQRSVKVYFNDAGAMHSGNHWTWVVEDSWVLGRRVVAQGYLSPDVAVSGGAVPVTWADGNRLEVAFLPARYSRSR